MGGDNGRRVNSKRRCAEHACREGEREEGRERERERERERAMTCTLYVCVYMCVVCACTLVTCFLEQSWCCSFPAFLGCLSRALQSSDMCYQLSATMPTAKQACIDSPVPSPQNNMLYSHHNNNIALYALTNVLAITLHSWFQFKCIYSMWHIHGIVCIIWVCVVPLNACNLHIVSYPSIFTHPPIH